MRVHTFCFFASAFFGVAGMVLGFVMGAGAGFTLVSVHAHLNLLGWVGMALYGLYHRGVERARNRLAWAQVGCSAAAVPTMTGPLAAYLITGYKPFIVAAMLSSLLAILGLGLFVAVLVADLRLPETATGRVRPGAA